MSRILIVDDNPADVRLLAEALKELQRRDDIDVASDGVDALERIRGGGYDLVLMDIRMPRMSGVEVLERIAREGGRSNVVMLTTTSSPAEHMQCMDLGAARVLVKPSDFDELCATLQEILP